MEIGSARVTAMRYSALRDISATLKGKLAYYQAVYRHPDTPWLAKALLWAAVAYALSPVDLIPDFIPVLGHLDDLVIVPGLVWVAVRLIPGHVLDECRNRASNPVGVRCEPKRPETEDTLQP